MQKSYASLNKHIIQDDDIKKKQSWKRQKYRLKKGKMITWFHILQVMLPDFEIDSLTLLYFFSLCFLFKIDQAIKCIPLDSCNGICSSHSSLFSSFFSIPLHSVSVEMGKVDKMKSKFFKSVIRFFRALL